MAKLNQILAVEKTTAVLRAHGLPAVEARYVEVDKRASLEVERFDRLPGGGRRAAVTPFWLAPTATARTATR